MSTWVIFRKSNAKKTLLGSSRPNMHHAASSVSITLLLDLRSWGDVRPLSSIQTQAID
jgi:hypothetical protein